MDRATPSSRRATRTTRRASDEDATRMAGRIFGAERDELITLGLLVLLDKIIDEKVARGEAERILVRGEPGFRLLPKRRKVARAVKARRAQAPTRKKGRA